MTKGKNIVITSSKIPPCKDCTERFLACHGKCPKDQRGEYGYAAYKRDIDDIRLRMKSYDKSRYNKYPR